MKQSHTLPHVPGAHPVLTHGSLPNEFAFEATLAARERNLYVVLVVLTGVCAVVLAITLWRRFLRARQARLAGRSSRFARSSLSQEIAGPASRSPAGAAVDVLI